MLLEEAINIRELNNSNSGIYKITNTINNKFYIGSSVNLGKRKYKHKFELDKNIHSNIHLQRAWNKYNGIYSFTFEIILLCAEQDLIKEEQYYIDLLKPEYNICKTAYSTLGKPTSEKQKETLRNRKGTFTHTKESKRLMRDNALGRFMSNTTRDKIAKALSVPVVSIDSNGNMKEYPSAKIASSLAGCSSACITRACRNPGYKAVGLIWLYKEKIKQ